MKNLLKVKENDTLLVAAGKGMIQGALKAGVVCLTIGAGLMATEILSKGKEGQAEEKGE